MNKVKGNIITMALNGKFDVIAHGCNCQCVQKSGMAAQMVQYFYTDSVTFFELESDRYKGDVNKLGQIEYNRYYVDGDKSLVITSLTEGRRELPEVIVVNCYTQFYPGVKFIDSILDYEALTMCMRKINHIFTGKKVGLPMIGAGLAKGDWSRIEKILEKELSNVDLTIVEYDKG